jgi:hypothetical protein
MTDRRPQRTLGAVERKGQGLLAGLGVLLLLALAGGGQLVAAVRNTRVLTHIRVDRWARRHGW